MQMEIWDGGEGLHKNKKTLHEINHTGFLYNSLAPTYSPTQSPMQYHQPNGA